MAFQLNVSCFFQFLLADAGLMPQLDTTDSFHVLSNLLVTDFCLLSTLSLLNIAINKVKFIRKFTFLNPVSISK